MAGAHAAGSLASERRRRTLLVRCGTLAATTATVALALIPTFGQQTSIPLLGVAFLGTLLVNLMVFERTGGHGHAVAIILASVAAFFLVVVHYRGGSPSTVTWAYLFQPFPYLLAGRRRGVATILVFDVALLAVILRTADRPASIAAESGWLVAFMASLVALALASFVFEHVRKSAHDRLIIEIGERRRAETDARKASQAAARAVAMQARFLANMSHEIRTPMNGVLGVNELLLLTQLTSEQRDYAETINASARSLLAVLNDILDLSKIESGNVVLEARQFDLHAFVTRLVALYRPEAEAKGLAMSFEVDDKVPRAVVGDDLRLHQILSNLLRNAVKFTHRGDVRLKVSSARKDRIRFEVWDTGIGLTAEQKRKIFDPFQQADTSTTREYGGTGLGLSISKQLVGLMGGQIGADGRPGRGSVFWFVVALPESELPSEEPTVRISMPAESPPPEHRRVLVVEDNPVNRKVVCRMLARLDLEVETAENGMVALELWEPGRYLMVFMDLQMPRMDGFDTTRGIRKQEAPGARMPIVALTANAMPGDRERCLAAGMDDYLSKPVVFRELKRVVREWAVPGDKTVDLSIDSSVGSSGPVSVPSSAAMDTAPLSTTAS